MRAIGLVIKRGSSASRHGQGSESTGVQLVDWSPATMILKPGSLCPEEISKLAPYVDHESEFPV